jgi:hypothetical protein
VIDRKQVEHKVRQYRTLTMHDCRVFSFLTHNFLQIGCIIHDAKHRLLKHKAVMVEHVFTYNGCRRVVRMLKAIRNPHSVPHGECC